MNVARLVYIPLQIKCPKIIKQTSNVLSISAALYIAFYAALEYTDKVYKGLKGLNKSISNYCVMTNE